jgi:hypothetical protein
METKIQANPRREEKLECLDEGRSSKRKKIKVKLNGYFSNGSLNGERVVLRKVQV